MGSFSVFEKWKLAIFSAAKNNPQLSVVLKQFQLKLFQQNITEAPTVVKGFFPPFRIRGIFVLLVGYGNPFHTAPM